MSLFRLARSKIQNPKFISSNCDTVVLISICFHVLQHKLSTEFAFPCFVSGTWQSTLDTALLPLDSLGSSLNNIISSDQRPPSKGQYPCHLLLHLKSPNGIRNWRGAAQHPWQPNPSPCLEISVAALGQGSACCLRTGVVNIETRPSTNMKTASS